MIKRFYTVLMILVGANVSMAEPDILLEMDEIMMRSTVKIQSGNHVGTGFILRAPLATNTTMEVTLLVTAAHVFSNMPSTNVTLSLRSGQATYQKCTFDIPIRLNGTNLWTRHPQADVAAIQISAPQLCNSDFASMGMLVGDKFLSDFRIHPGDELRVLGFPYGYEANNAGFPVLRSGRIASYPLTPTKDYPTFMIDFRVFPGNSGGPVYISERRAMEKGSLATVSVTGIVGLVSEEAKITEQVHSLNEHSIKQYQLGLGIVVPTRFIIETLLMIRVIPPQ